MDFSASGTKEVARFQLKAQIPDEQVAAALVALIDALPGDQVSVSGSVSTTGTAKAGSFTMSGSSWTT